MRFYYEVSPSLADYIEGHELLKTVVRIGLLPLVAISYSTLHFGLWATLAVVVLLLGLMGMTATVTLRRIRLRG